MKLPCDTCVWSIIPMIKRELVLRLFNEHELSMTNIAARLGVTRGSVTQYIQGKRASDSPRLRKFASIDRLISLLARDISEKRLSAKELSRRFCMICRRAQKEVLPQYDSG